MESKAERISQEVKSKAEKASMADSLMAQTLVQFDTMAEIQKEERLELAKMHNEELDKMRKHYGKIIIGLILTLAILLGGIIGGVVYILANYDIGYYNQTTYDNSVINDGIEYSRGTK